MCHLYLLNIYYANCFKVNRMKCFCFTFFLHFRGILFIDLLKRKFSLRGYFNCFL